jgi:hypothetical protein
LKLFKLKSFEGDGLLHVLDIVIHNRLYLSTCDYVNDVDEGSWKISDKRDQESIEIAGLVREIVDRQRFTCFVESINNPLMWAHYAGGFSGVALEYNLSQGSLDIRKIDYDGIPEVSVDQMRCIVSGNYTPQDVGILKSKAQCWDYEDEWRLYGKGDQLYVEDIKPESVIFGARKNKCDAVVKKIARQFEVKVGYLRPYREKDYKIIYV